MPTPRMILNVLAAVLFSTITSGTAAYAGFAENPFSYIKNNADGSQVLTGHVPREIKKALAVFQSHASLNINAQVIMPLANPAQLSQLLSDLYNPKSANFHHFLTPLQFAQQFGTSAIDSIPVKEFLNKEGISVSGQSPNWTVLKVSGPSEAFERAFGLQINYYQKADGRMFFGPDADPTIPANLAGKILAIGGLDNFPKYHAHLKPLASASPQRIGTGPGGFLAPNDVKTAYNLNAVPSNGSGQTIALFELDGYAPSDVTAYESYFGLPAVPLQNIPIDGFNGAPDYSGGGAYEVTLDIEIASAMAPGSSDILVYEASNTTQSWIDEWTRIYTDDKAKVISCSWGEPESDSPTLSFDYTTFQEMASQGQAVFVASGDDGAYDDGSTLSVDEPASQPFATAVGISKLSVNTGEVYKGETASVYGGGGISADYAIPSYQATAASQAVAAAMVSTTMRNLPDVVLTADASTPYSFYINGSWSGWYGSSIASPIWASFTSRVNQGLGANAPLGSADSALYQIAQGGNYTNDFHDITTGNNGYYPAEPGFDDATGLGSFNGLNLYNDLVNAYGAQPPVVAVTSPVTGSKFVSGSNITLTASASEVNGTISKVSFYNGSTLLGTATSSPYTFLWNNVPSGNYSLTATATGANGISTTSNPVTITVSTPVPEIITNNDPTKVTIVGAWTASTSVAGYYGTDYIHDGNVLKGTKNVKFTPALAGGAGSYQVYIWYTSATSRATNVPVDIIHAGVTTTATVNEQVGGGGWVSLGTYNFLANGSGEGVNIRTTGTNGYVIANAVEFGPVPLAPPEIITNNDPTKVTIVGAWTASTSVAGYYGTDYIHDGNVLKGTKNVKFTPALAGGAGSYQVYIWYTSATSRATNVPVDIIHAGVTTTVTVNEQVGGGGWVSLGTYNFLANGSGEGVNIRTTGTNGYVIANAVEFISQ